MPDPVLANSRQAWALWLDSTLEDSQRVQIYRDNHLDCVNADADWSDVAACKGIDSAGGAVWIGEDDYGVGYFHLTSGRTSWALTHQEWGCNGSTGLPYFNGASLGGQVVNIYDAAGGAPGSSVRPRDGAVMIPHTGYPVCAALEFDGPGGGYLAFIAGDAAELTVASAAAALGMIARTQKIVLGFS